MANVRRSNRLRLRLPVPRWKSRTHRNISRWNGMVWEGSVGEEEQRTYANVGEPGIEDARGCFGPRCLSLIRDVRGEMLEAECREDRGYPKSPPGRL